ncbi:MAG: PspA/IM30 family protein [Oceanospirillaceae bacterium]|nr:PspA/IM30 family protein [Oceanospirillaceae bacterium]
MSLLKRLSATLFARIDGVVGEIEDHQAVVETSIDELRRQVARARARLNQMQREEQQLDDRVEKQRQEAERWEERARSCAAEDEARALACLERRRRAQKEAERLKRNLRSCQEAGERLARDIDDSETRLEDLSQRHLEMRARQCGNAARVAGPEPDGGLLREVETCFERWDARLSEQELRIGSIHAGDTLDDGFAREERDAELRAELDALLREKKS